MGSEVAKESSEGGKSANWIVFSDATSLSFNGHTLFRPLYIFDASKEYTCCDWPVMHISAQEEAEASKKNRSAILQSLSTAQSNTHDMAPDYRHYPIQEELDRRKVH